MDTKLLRQKILDLAIHGKLVPQDPADEPAIELLNRINPRAEISCNKGQYPCAVPKGWIVGKLGEVVSIVNGKSQKNVEDKNGKYPIYGSGGIIGHANQYLCLAGSTIIGRKGTINNPIFVSEDFWNVDTAFGMKPQGIISDIYFFYFCLSFNFSKLDKSTAVPSLTKTTIGNISVPIPPLSEQHRIVAEIEKWFSLIDSIESSKNDLQSTIKQTKSKILDLAIHGKLVPQNPKDEPAIELLKRINPKAEISCDNVQNEQLPYGWCMCKLDDVLEYEQPQSYIVSSTNYDDSYKTPVLTAGKSFIIGYTDESKGICNNLPVIIFDDFTTDSKYVDFPFKVKSSAMKILHSKERGINLIYISYYMNNTRLVGDTHKRYWISEYAKLNILLPPKEEQDRIVTKIEELFAVIDNIQKSLEA